MTATQGVEPKLPLPVARASIEPRPAAPRDLSVRAEPRVEVRIGRVEVRRAPPPPPAHAPARAAPTPPARRGFDDLAAARRYVDRIGG